MNRSPQPSPSRLWLRAGVVWLALSLALTATIAGAHLDIGAWKLPLAMAIAVFKAGLVVLIFMEMAKAGAGSRIALLAGGLWLALMIGLVLADVTTRADLSPDNERHSHQSSPH